MNDDKIGIAFGVLFVCVFIAAIVFSVRYLISDDFTEISQVQYDKVAKECDKNPEYKALAIRYIKNDGKITISEFKWLELTITNEEAIDRIKIKSNVEKE
jgi:hypothetical protein